MQKSIGTLQKIYNSTPTNFIVCGGDWLNNNDTKEQACFKLGYIDGFMNSMFNNYYPILGNHDYNYQGKENEEAEDNTGILDNNTLKNLWFRKFEKCYYCFDGINSKNYVLDTGTDWNLPMNSYKWEQLQWLANSLLSDNNKNIIIWAHIIYYTSEHLIAPMTSQLGNIIESYNNHSTISVNGTTYDFSQCTGHIDFILSGHIHADFDGTIGGVPAIATKNTSLSIPNCDLCLVDYDNRKLKMIRVGSGENREFDF